MSTLPTILFDWLHRRRCYSLTDLARAAGCSESLISKVMNEERDLKFDAAQRIALFTSRRGDNEIAELCIDRGRFEVCPRGQARSDGRIDDEIADMVEVMGEARTLHHAGDKDQLTQRIHDMEQVLRRMKAERDRL